MLQVHLVRHGVTDATGERLGGRTPAPLSDAGRRQAQAVADRLLRREIIAVYASPIARTLETAQVVAGGLGLPVRDLDGVQEVDYGDWTDRPLADLREEDLWGPIQRTPSRVTFPGGEAIRTAQARAVNAIETVVAGHHPREDASPERTSAGAGDAAEDEDEDREEPPPAVVVVSHADVIKAVVAHFAGVPLDLFQRLVVSPASITTLLLSPVGVPRLVALNDIAHLTQDGEG